MKKGNRKKALSKSETTKPQKPYAGFPLNPHASGNWQNGNSTFVARTVRRFEARAESAGISGCTPPGLVACDF